MNTKKPLRKRPEDKEDQNKLIVYLKKVHNWDYIDIKQMLEREWGIKITRQRVRTIYRLYSKLYTKKSFKSYEAPGAL